jgi:hypothetical protein
MADIGAYSMMFDKSIAMRLILATSIGSGGGIKDAKACTGSGGQPLRVLRLVTSCAIPKFGA